MSRRLLFKYATHGFKARLVTLAAASILYGSYAAQPALRNDSNGARLGQLVHTDEKLSRGSKSHSFDESLAKEDGRISNTNVDPTASSEEDVPLFDSNDDGAWAAFSSHFATARASISSIPWSSLGDRIADAVLPDWAQALPGYIQKLQLELSAKPGSLANEIWQEALDRDINPEIEIEASVRFSKELCNEEKDFRMRRRRQTTKALAKYLDIPDSEIDPEDVPTIAMCGSGGGLRALVAGASSYLCTQDAGLFDCVTYTAGVSGSCWLQTLYYSSLGGQRHNRVVDHLRQRISTHIAYPPAALDLFTTAPTNKFLLSGCVEKLKADPTADFGLVDVYGLLLAARLLIPRGELGVNPYDLKISNQRAYLTRGNHPMPIYTAVRHEIPLNTPKNDLEKSDAPESLKQKAKEEAWFQWFEFTPYEFWCEELDAGIPSFAVGRKFKNGRSILQKNGFGQPEAHSVITIPRTLVDILIEVRPLIKGLAGFGGIDDLLEERNDDLVKVHPIDPASVPNFAFGLDDTKLSPTTPKSIFSSEHLELMDAGMSNNLPIYPLLRNGRDVDVLIAFDASADIKTENWLSVADGYAKQRGIKGWPIGAGWPKGDAPEDLTQAELGQAEAASPQQAAGKIADIREARRPQSKTPSAKDTELSYCNVWVGTTIERQSDDEPPHSKRVQPDADWKLMDPNAGIAVIYFPFLPNPKVAGVDPDKSDFMSTWNFVYTPDNIDKVVSLARANFEEGKEQTKRTIRAVYERKKAKRLEREGKARISNMKKQLRESGDHFV
ncbi:MAG: hypothetical protein Q9195_005471 [Heterodermia aff. obscurata]